MFCAVFFLANLNNNLSYIIYRKFPIYFAFVFFYIFSYICW